MYQACYGLHIETTTENTMTHDSQDIDTIRRWIIGDLLPLAQHAKRIAGMSPEIERATKAMATVFEQAGEFAYAGAAAECQHLSSDEFHDAWLEAAKELSLDDYKNEIESYSN